MFDHDRLEETLDIQERCYRLLKWVNSSLAHETLAFDVMHDAMTAAEATEDWLRRNLANIPPDARPIDEQLHRFAMFFSSYLSTSFELLEKPVLSRRSRNCYCICCRFMSEARHLRARKVNDKARAGARDLKRIWLEDLALSLDRAPSQSEIDRLMGDREITEDIALTAWANEMMRRTEFASQGVGVLALWREFAWQNNAPKKRFRLSPENVLGAEARVAEAVSAL